jgi:hypothetical protein
MFTTVQMNARELCTVKRAAARPWPGAAGRARRAIANSRTRNTATCWPVHSPTAPGSAADHEGAKGVEAVPPAGAAPAAVEAVSGGALRSLGVGADHRDTLAHLIGNGGNAEPASADVGEGFGTPEAG